jgi:hypothetical protein
MRARTTSSSATQRIWLPIVSRALYGSAEPGERVAVAAAEPAGDVVEGGVTAGVVLADAPGVRDEVGNGEMVAVVVGLAVMDCDGSVQRVLQRW